MNDDDIILKAFIENWILITNDKDFGEKIYREQRPHHGVILLRLDDERTESKVKVLSKLLQSYSDQLPDKYVVVTDKGARFARK